LDSSIGKRDDYAKRRWVQGNGAFSWELGRTTEIVDVPTKFILEMKNIAEVSAV
jgi:hypothetical protein